MAAPYFLPMAGHPYTEPPNPSNNARWPTANPDWPLQDEFVLTPKVLKPQFVPSVHRLMTSRISIYL